MALFFLKRRIILTVEKVFKSIILRQDYLVPRTKYRSLADRSPQTIFLLIWKEFIICSNYNNFTVLCTEELYLARLARCNQQVLRFKFLQKNDAAGEVLGNLLSLTFYLVFFFSAVFFIFVLVFVVVFNKCFRGNFQRINMAFFIKRYLQPFVPLFISNRTITGCSRCCLQQNYMFFPWRTESIPHHYKACHIYT